MAQGKKNESKIKSGDLSSDFDRILLTPVTSIHQLLGRREAWVISRYTTPNILLIDFRETVSRCAEEVTNWLKLLTPRARSLRTFWFVVLPAAPHNDESGRVEYFNYSEKVKEVVEVWEIQHGLVAMWRLRPFGMQLNWFGCLPVKKNIFLFFFLNSNENVKSVLQKNTWREQ